MLQQKNVVAQEITSYMTLGKGHLTAIFKSGTDFYVWCEAWLNNCLLSVWDYLLSKVINTLMILENDLKPENHPQKKHKSRTYYDRVVSGLETHWKGETNDFPDESPIFDGSNIGGSISSFVKDLFF